MGWRNGLKLGTLGPTYIIFLCDDFTHLVYSIKYLIHAYFKSQGSESFLTCLHIESTKDKIQMPPSFVR